MKKTSTLLLIASLLLPLSVLAEDTPFQAGFRDSLLKSYDDATGKIMQLADAIPEDKYGWRPMDGVNSVQEVLQHVTQANLGIGGMLGAKAPAGLDRKTVGAAMKTKADAIATTKSAIDAVREALATIPANQLMEEVDFFGGKAPKFRVVMILVGHEHEHLGQLIAYARSNHVVPPWSK